MTKEELINLLNDIEWEDFEAKEAKSAIPKNIWETVSAFSNSVGGWIVLGIKQQQDQFIITGVNNPEKIENDFITTLRGEKFNNPILPVAKKYQFEQGTVLAFYIPPSGNKPVYFNNPKNTFIRSGSGDQRATQQEIDALFRNASYGTKDGMLTEFDKNGINSNTLERYKQLLAGVSPHHRYLGANNDDFLNKLRAVSGGKLTFAGALMLGEEDVLNSLFNDFRVDYMEIPGTTYTNAEKRYTYRLPLQENLFEYFFAIFQRILKYVDVPFEMTRQGFASAAQPQVEAIREALVNMLMHSDYFSQMKPRIRAFTDRIEFFNPGALPKNLKLILKEDISLPRNPVIAKMFRLINLAENAGFGFEKMIQGWKSAYNVEPVIESGFDYFIISFPTKVAKEPVSTDKLGDKLGDRLGDRLGDNEIKIIELIQENNTISISQMAEKLSISTTAIENNINRLKTKGILSREGKPKSGYWILHLD